MNKNLAQGSLRTFFIGNTLACIGFNFGVIAVSWFIVDAVGHNEVLGTYWAISLFMSFVTLFLVGGIIDRCDKFRLLRWCAVAVGLLFLLAAGAYTAEFPIKLVIYALAFFYAPCAFLFMTTARAVLPGLSPASSLTKANAGIEISLQIGALGAAGLTGLLYDHIGFSGLMSLSASLLFLSLIFLTTPKKITDIAPIPTTASLLAGFSYFGNRKYLFIYGLAVFVPSLIISAFNTVLPGYVEQILKAGASVYAAGDMLFALGAFAAGIMFSFVKSKKIHARLAQTILFILAALTIFYSAMNQEISFFFMAILLCGLSLGGLRIVLTARLMEVVAPSYIGRALSLLTALITLLQALTAWCMGWMMDWNGANTGFIVLGFLLLLGWGILKTIDRRYIQGLDPSGSLDPGSRK